MGQAAAIIAAGEPRENGGGTVAGAERAAVPRWLGQRVRRTVSPAGQTARGGSGRIGGSRLNRAKSLAVGIGVSVLITRMTLAWYCGEAIDGRVFWLLLLSGVLIHAVATLLQSRGLAAHDRPAPPEAAWWLWCGILLIAIALWPYAFDPDKYSLAALLFWGSLVAAPAAVADSMRPPTLQTGTAWHVGARRCAWVGLAVAGAATVGYLWAIRPNIGSVDFYYYVCTARDMVTHPDEVSDNCYCYFPGVYAFWRAVIRLAGAGLDGLQSGYIALLVINGCLIWAVVARVTRDYLAALSSAIWYFVLISRFEGFAGVSEPLSTAAALAGLLIWNGLPLRGWRGAWRTVGLGAALGLAVYAKQQGGLVTLGAAALLLGQCTANQQDRHRWQFLAALPVIALLVLLTGVWAEGRGWVPLTRGMTMAADYGREGTLLRNLYTQVRGDESAALAAGLMVLGWLGVWWSRSWRRQFDGRAWQVVSFAVIAFLASLIQFASRPFGHYMLLGLPWLVIGAVVLGHQLVSWIPERVRCSRLVQVLLWGAAILPLWNTSGRDDTLYVWRLTVPHTVVKRSLWHDRPEVRADLDRLAGVVPRGAKMYVLPPRQNSVYYLLGARTANPDGYWFHRRDPARMPWDECRFVLLLVGTLERADYEFCSLVELDETRRLLRVLGFRPRCVDQLRAMELYERPESRSNAARRAPGSDVGR